MKLNKEDLPPTDGVWKYNNTLHCWYSELNMQVHNSLGPAIIYDRGEKQWWVDDTPHRLDGPAVEHANGLKEWWIEGNRIHEQDFSSAVISFLLGVDDKTAEIIEQEMKL